MTEPNSIDAIGERPSIRRHLLGGTIIGLLLTAGLGGWAASTEFVGAIVATGTIVVNSNVKKVQHPTGGIVAELNIREGMLVHAGDIVVRLDGEPVTGVDDLIRMLNGDRIGRSVEVDVVRRGQLRSFKLRPAERQAAKAA